RVEGDWTDASMPGDVAVTSGASIVANGNDADAISVSGNGHVVQVEGSLTTNGTYDRPGTLDASAGRIDGAQGIEVVGDDNRIELYAGATITGNGDSSHGIAMHGDGTIHNAGTITMS